MRYISASLFRLRLLVAGLPGLLLLALLPGGVRAQSITVARADSLKGLLREGKPDTSRVQALFKLSDHYLRRTLDAEQNRDSALVLARRAGELSKQLSYPEGQEEAIFLAGKIYVRQGEYGLVRQLLARVSEVNRIRLLLELGKQQMRSTNTQKASRDSALVFFRRAEKRSARIRNQPWREESQALMGVAYLLEGDRVQSKAYFNKAIEARQKAGDKAGELNLWLRIATTTRCDDCREESSAWARALDLARQTGDKAREAVSLIGLGNISFIEGDLGRAEQLDHQALEIQRVIGYPAVNRVVHALAAESVYNPQSLYTNFSNAYFGLIDVSLDRKNFNQALLYLFAVIKDIERNALPEELAYPYFGLGNVYFDLGQFDKSLRYYQKSLAASHQKGEAVVNLMVIRRMTELMVKAGKAKEALEMLEDLMGQHLPLTDGNKVTVAVSFGNCYSALRQYHQAEKYYLEAIAWSKQSAYYFGQIFAMYHAGQFYVTTGQYPKARPLLKEILAYYAGKELAHEVWQAPLLQFKIDSAMGNYSAAIRHYQQYIALKDSIFNETKSQQIEQLGVQYETEKKEQDLRLKEQSIALLREQNKAQQNQRNALIGGTALLLALLGLGYNRYRLKQHSNRLLHTQQQVLQAQQGELHAQQQQISQKNQDLLKLLEEKERLLKEIHHRVKNNLQIVMSLLNSQADSLQDQAALSAIQESQHRVQAMALIHQKLYQNEGVARIPMRDYIEEVVAYLHESYCLSLPVHFCLEVEEIELDIALAVPLGLIINETITNAFKYAFPGSRPGRISLALHRLATARYELTVADDGVGLPEGYDPSRSRSLGMTLLHGFSAQLGGKLVITNRQGLTIRLVFEEEQFSPSYARAAHVP